MPQLADTELQMINIRMVFVYIEIEALKVVKASSFQLVIFLTRIVEVTDRSDSCIRSYQLGIRYRRLLLMLAITQKNKFRVHLY